jgi:hypothetical protein
MVADTLSKPACGIAAASDRAPFDLRDMALCPLASHRISRVTSRISRDAEEGRVANIIRLASNRMDASNIRVTRNSRDARKSIVSNIRLASKSKIDRNKSVVSHSRLPAELGCSTRNDASKSRVTNKISRAANNIRHASNRTDASKITVARNSRDASKNTRNSKNQ